MNYSDTLYRALIDYRKNTLENNECKTQRAAIIPADSENDKIVIKRQNCIVEEDWLEAIERGLEFVEKAIKEERQFIRSNGEVIPIEKVKRVSKDSVEHLARHSNYFTREQEEGKDLIPDQLYTVERLSDYAVYENRFLYMLLCYLRDFIGMRYEKIVELTNTYNGNMEMNKSVVESNRRIRFEIKLEEEKKNDEYLREHNKAQKEIDRILTVYKAVVLYLNTPLMVEVAKTPMIKPPIMRTNVLKMNRNFREALSLYEYVTAYDKDGYTIETETRQVSPFVGTVGEEFAEMAELALFLTYEHGLGIRDYLKKRYDAEEERRLENERRKLAEQIRNIARHLKTDGITAEQYILLLEKRIRDLEKVEEELAAAKAKILSQEKEIENLQMEMAATQEKMRLLSDEMMRLQKEYALQIERLQIENEEKIAQLTAEFEQKIDEINAACTQAIEEANAACEQKIAEIEYERQLKEEALNAQIAKLEEEKLAAEEAHAKELEETRTEFLEKIRALNEAHLAKTNELNGQIAKGAAEMKALSTQYETLKEEKSLLAARYKSLRLKYGESVADKDFTTKEGMDELESELKAFKNFFNEEWKKTKKRIRQDMLGTIKEIFKNIFSKTEKEKKAEVQSDEKEVRFPSLDTKAGEALEEAAVAEDVSESARETTNAGTDENKDKESE